MLATTSPFPQYFDTDGSPLTGGELYFGEAGEDPVASPVPIFWDAAGLVPAAQPVIVMNGFSTRNGTPANVYTAGAYSVQAVNAGGVTVYYAADSANFSNGLTLEASVTALRNDIASSTVATKGAGMSGYDVELVYPASSVGAALQRWKTLQDFGAACDGVTNDTAAVIAALASGEPIKVMGQALIDGDIAISSGAAFFSDDPTTNGFLLNPQPVIVTGGVHGWFRLTTNANVDGVLFEGIGFWGQFDTGYPGSTVFSVIKIAPQSGFVHKNINFHKCRFLDPVQNCIGISPNSGGTVNNVWVDKCSADVSVSLANSSRTANLVQSVLEYIDWAGHSGSYGTVTCTTNLFVTNCSARGIRTLADVKRGTRRFVLSNLNTLDMSDCHNSIDGSFAGIVSNIICKQSSSLLPNKNALEVQGEDISIRGINVDFDISFGSNAGVMVTGYAYPVEGVGVSHQSRNIRIEDATFYGIDGTCIRLLDVDTARISNIYARQMTNSVISVEHVYTGLSPTHTTIDDVRAPTGTGTGYVVDISGTAKKTRIGRISARASRTNTANYKPLYRDGTEYIGDRSMLLVGGVLPGFTAAAAAISNVADGPKDRGVCVEVNDATGAALGCLVMDGAIPCEQYETVSVRVWAKLGTASACGLRFQEYDGTTFLAQSFQALTATGAGWTENVKHFTANDADCTHVVVSFMAATDSGNVASTGTSRFVIDGIAEGTV